MNETFFSIVQIWCSSSSSSFFTWIFLLSFSLLNLSAHWSDTNLITYIYIYISIYIYILYIFIIHTNAPNGLFLKMLFNKETRTNHVSSSCSFSMKFCWFSYRWNSDGVRKRKWRNVSIDLNSFVASIEPKKWKENVVRRKKNKTNRRRFDFVSCWCFLVVLFIL